MGYWRFMRHVQKFAKDVQQAYKDAIKAFYDAGCRYLQFDDVYWGSLCNNHLKPAFVWIIGKVF